MKTIDQAAKENASNIKGSEQKGIAYYSFKKGVEFAQNWIDVKIELPLAWESGDWDGKKSDTVLIKTKRDDLYLASFYKGILDCTEFECFFEYRSDFEISHVTHWKPIELI